MKRVLTILAILLLPLSVWAMTPVNDSDLSDVTGQAGVSINMNVAMNVNIGTMAWGDSTGVDGSQTHIGGGWGTAIGTAGYVGIKGFNITNLKIKFRDDTYAGFASSSLKPLTIDVASVPAGADQALLYTGGITAPLTFVRIGLGSLQISLQNLSFTVAMGATVGTTAADLAQNLGYVNIGAIDIYINPKSYVDFSNGGRTGAGVTIGMDVIVDQFNMGYMNWGGDGIVNSDISGIVTMNWISTAATGYIGLNDLKIGGPITVKGVVNIDVGNTANGLYATAHGGPMAYVHISFGSRGLAAPSATFATPAGLQGFEVKVGQITADVLLSSSATFATGNSTLGDIYISGLNLQIYRGSWVDIFAH